METTTHSKQETIDFAKNFAKKLKGGEILALIGELGTGKTIFAQGLALGLGIKQNLSSPTYVFMKLYEIKSSGEGQEKIKRLCHIDAYRAEHEYDIINIGAEDFIGKKDIITVIEWGDRIRNILPPRTTYLYFTSQGENERLIKTDETA